MGNRNFVRSQNTQVGVTTTRSAKGLQTRAKLVAERVGAPFIERRGSGLSKLLKRHQLECLYICGNEREWIVDEEGKTLFVHAGLFKTRSRQNDHPLIRLFKRDDTIIDATCGRAQDALFLAHQGHQVRAFERSPLLYALLEKGLAQLAALDGDVARAASRIDLHFGEARSFSDQKVYIDPMWQCHAKPSLMERVAYLKPFDFSLYKNAAQVVIKSAPHAPMPKGLGAMRCIRSERACYWHCGAG